MMESNTYEKLRQTQLKRKCEKLIESLPDGKLELYRTNGRSYYRRSVGGKRIYIKSSEQKLLNQLKMKAMLSDMLEAIDYNLETMAREMKEINPNVLKTGSIYEDIPDEMIEKACFVPEGQIEKVPQYKKFKDKRILATLSGYKVASTHEQKIADFYSLNNVVFQYEPEVILEDGTVIHPDFRVYVKRENRYKLHEHCGMLSDPSYRESLIWKMRKYIDCGLMPDDDVIFTYGRADGSIDMNKVANIISMHML